MFPLSGEHGRGFTEFLDDIALFLPKTTETETDSDEIRVAIVGRQNAGKSTLLNKLVGEDRSMVSSVAGTTRDAVDSLVREQGHVFSVCRHCRHSSPRLDQRKG